MILTFIKCEMCKKQYRHDPHVRPWDIPDGWFILCQGPPQTVEGLTFCSKRCVARWAAPIEESITVTCQDGGITYKGVVYPVEESSHTDVCGMEANK